MSFARLSLKYFVDIATVLTRRVLGYFKQQSESLKPCFLSSAKCNKENCGLEDVKQK